MLEFRNFITYFLETHSQFQKPLLRFYNIHVGERHQGIFDRGYDPLLKQGQDQLRPEKKFENTSHQEAFPNPVSPWKIKFIAQGGGQHEIVNVPKVQIFWVDFLLSIHFHLVEGIPFAENCVLVTSRLMIQGHAGIPPFSQLEMVPAPPIDLGVGPKFEKNYGVGEAHGCRTE